MEEVLEVLEVLEVEEVVGGRAGGRAGGGRAGGGGGWVGGGASRVPAQVEPVVAGDVSERPDV